MKIDCDEFRVLTGVNAERAPRPMTNMPGYRLRKHSAARIVRVQPEILAAAGLPSGALEAPTQRSAK